MKTKARAPRWTSTSCLDSCAPKIGSRGASGRGVGHAQTIQPMQCHAMPSTGSLPPLNSAGTVEKCRKCVDRVDFAVLTTARGVAVA